MASNINLVDFLDNNNNTFFVVNWAKLLIDRLVIKHKGQKERIKDVRMFSLNRRESKRAFVIKRVFLLRLLTF